MNTELKKEFLELLEKDAEFRYAVAGYLGLLEILKRLDKLGQGQNRLWEEVKALREGQNKLWDEVMSLRKSHNRLWNGFRSFLRDFRELGRAVGMTLDHYTASFLSMYLEEKGYPPDKIRIDVNARFRVDDKVVEVDIFNSDPLIIGEVTTYIRSRDEAKREVEKLLEKKRVMESIFGRRAEMTILTVANIEEEVLQFLEELAKKNGITLFAGRKVRTLYSM